MILTEDSFLDGRLTLLQPKKGPRAAIDALFLAAAIPGAIEEEGASPKRRILEAGTGSGIVSLALATRLSTPRLYAIEREPDLVKLARKNVQRNQLQSRLSIIEGDITKPLKDIGEGELRQESFHHVLANPPFFITGFSRPSPNKLKERAHIGPPDTLSSWIRFLSLMTAPKGSLTLIHRAEAVGKILDYLKGSFGNIIVFPLFSHDNEPAKRVIVQAQKSSQAPLRLLPGMVLHQGDGHYTEDAQKILRGAQGLDLHDRIKTNSGRKNNAPSNLHF